MDRLSLFLWLLVIGAIVVIISVLSRPTEQVLLSFTLEEAPVESVEWIAELLRENGATGTFFVYGSYAAAHPELIRSLAADFEVGCMTMNSTRLPELNVSAVKEQIGGCKETIEGIINGTVAGFKAPNNLLDERTHRALEELGFQYVASSYENYGWFYPKAHITQIPTSTYILLPLQDSILANWFFLGDFTYFVMRQDRDTVVSLNFNPHTIDKHRRAFSYLFGTYLEYGVNFTTHEMYTSTA